MPTRTYIRFWCTKCNDFTLYKTCDDKSCKECGTVINEYNTADVPAEKIMQQRKRYSESKGNFMDVYLKALNPMQQFEEVFSENIGKVEIIEDDAGQKSIDDKRQKETLREIEQQRIERQNQRAEAARHAKLGRNDICICGSKKKYKHCCMQRIQSYKLL